MFALVVHEEGRPPWRKAYALREVAIGSAPAPANGLVLDARGRVSARHARLVSKDGKYILVDLKSGSGTWVNGRKMSAPQVVKESDVIMLGEVRVEIVTLAYEEIADKPLVARDAMERGLLEAIGHGDEASRAVYADWLEGHGEHPRAELLRLQQAQAGETDEAAIDAATARMRELVASIDLPWRARISKLPIENCPQLAFACPRQWAELALTAVEGERFCGACKRTVHYCATIDEARARAGTGACVAIDLASPRWPGDLEPPFGMNMCRACDFDVGEALRHCPRCGGPLEAQMLLGRLA